MDFTRIAFDQKLALVPADSLASGSTDLKLLNMDMLVPVHMSRFVEPELEDNVFASVTSQVQAEGIQTLNVKGIRCREDNIRIDGHRHHRCVGSALKQIEITHAQAWILFRKFGIEMMGQVFLSANALLIIRAYTDVAPVFEVTKCLNGVAQVRQRGPWNTAEKRTSYSRPGAQICVDRVAGVVLGSGSFFFHGAVSHSAKLWRQKAPA